MEQLCKQLQLGNISIVQVQFRVRDVLQLFIVPVVILLRFRIFNSFESSVSCQ